MMRLRPLILTVMIVVASALAPLGAPAALPESFDEDGRLNILLLGSDAGPDRGGERTDTLLVVSLEPATGQAAIFGIPRNLVGVPLPAGHADAFECRCWPSMINALWGYAEANPWVFGANEQSGGGTALKGAISELLGIPIDYYALVDMAGFVSVIDALGGVTIDVPERVLIRLSPPMEGGEWRTHDILPGRQHLDGEEALAYSRSREDGSDYTRMHRQRCLLGALAREADVTSVLQSYPHLVSVLRESVRTDIPLDQLPDLIELAEGFDSSEIVAVGFVPPTYVEYSAEGHPLPNMPLIHAAVGSVFQNEVEVQDQALDTLPQTCEWVE